MEKEVKKIAECSYELNLKASKEEWSEYIEKAYIKLEKNVNVPGFRKGKAPKDVLRSKINVADVLDEAANSFLQKEFEKTVEENGYVLTERPHVHVHKISLEEIDAGVHFATEPVVTLGDYKNISVDKELASVLDYEINDKVMELREKNAELFVKEDGVVADGNVVIIDFEGFVDGVAFEGGKATNYQLEIGSGSFIPGFEQSLIGMNAGEDKDIDVTFPENYDPKLANKKAVFKIHLHEVKEKKIPEATDDLALDANFDDVSNLEELKEHYRKELFAEKENKNVNDALTKVIEKAVGNSKIEVSHSFIEREKEYALHNFEHDLSHKNLTLEQYLEQQKTSREDFDKKLEEDSLKNIKFAYVMMAIAKKENIEVTDEEIDETLEQIAKMYGQKLEEIKKSLGNRIYSLKQEILYNKIYEYLKRENKLV